MDEQLVVVAHDQGTYAGQQEFEAGLMMSDGDGVRTEHILIFDPIVT